MRIHPLERDWIKIRSKKFSYSRQGNSEAIMMRFFARGFLYFHSYKKKRLRWTMANKDDSFIKEATNDADDKKYGLCSVPNEKVFHGWIRNAHSKPHVRSPTTATTSTSGGKQTRKRRPPMAGSWLLPLTVEVPKRWPSSHPLPSYEAKVLSRSKKKGCEVTKKVIKPIYCGPRPPSSNYKENGRHPSFDSPEA